MVHPAARHRWMTDMFAKALHAGAYRRRAGLDTDTVYHPDQTPQTADLLSGVHLFFSCPLKQGAAIHYQ